MTRTLRKVPYPYSAFRDRRDAGRALAGFLAPYAKGDSVILALPRGGIPVGEGVAEAFDCPLEAVFVGKLPIPLEPEAGFGAVGIDGSTAMNDRLIAQLGLNQPSMDAVIRQVRQEVERRAVEYMGSHGSAPVEGKQVFIVDDGLASGYSMLAAARMVRKLAPKSLILAVPVAPADSLLTVAQLFDEANCLIVQTRLPFAVASFYEDFSDLSDAEVKGILKKRREALSAR